LVHAAVGPPSKCPRGRICTPSCSPTGFVRCCPVAEAGQRRSRGTRLLLRHLFTFLQRAGACLARCDGPWAGRGMVHTHRHLLSWQPRGIWGSPGRQAGGLRGSTLCLLRWKWEPRCALPQGGGDTSPST